MNKSEVLKAKACDSAFALIRNDCDKGIGLDKFQEHSREVTTTGYMPIVQSPAHELDSLNNVA